MTDKIREMESILAQVDMLHSSPPVACKLLSILQHDDFDVRDLTDILDYDPALTTSILRLVNSSYFGTVHNVSSVQQAVTLLGSRSLRLAVLSFGLLRRLNESTPARIYQGYWKRSLTMAAAATQIAGMNRGTAQDVAYSAGLLSDVGVLVFAQVQTDEYVAIHEQHHQSARLIREEEELFGFNHAELGAYMLRKWNLPEDLCQAILHHHEPPLTLSGLDITVAISDFIATSLWAPDSANVMTAQRLLQETVGLDADGFISLATKIQQTIDENAKLFSVDIDETIDCDALLQTARRTYQDVAMEAALNVDAMPSAASDHCTG